MPNKLLTSKDLSLEFNDISARMISTLLTQKKCKSIQIKRVSFWDQEQAREIIRVQLERNAEQMLRRENQQRKAAEAALRRSTCNDAPSSDFARWQAPQAQIQPFPCSSEELRAVAREMASERAFFWGCSYES